MNVGRFQVMSLLQAARAYTLGLPLESAHSWGLNRAIFIAAAKRGFKGGGSAGGSGAGNAPSGGPDTYFLGNDMAFKTEKNGVLFFTIGGEVQTEEAYDRQVRARFGTNYSAAWKEALDYTKGFDKDVLLSGEEFFRNVYRPVRDEWSERWTREGQPNDKIPTKPIRSEQRRRGRTDSAGRRTWTTAEIGSMPRPRPSPSSHVKST